MQKVHTGVVDPKMASEHQFSGGPAPPPPKINLSYIFLLLLEPHSPPHFTSVLTHNRSTISGATNHTQMDSTNAANESQLHKASMDLDNSCYIYVRMRSVLTAPTHLSIILAKYRVGVLMKQNIKWNGLNGGGLGAFIT